MSLVADYGTSSSERDEDDSTNDELEMEEAIEEEDKKRKITTLLLPSASSIFDGNSKVVSGEVFNNPYKEAENAHIASLEKHVKMTMLRKRESQLKKQLIAANKQLALLKKKKHNIIGTLRMEQENEIPHNNQLHEHCTHCPKEPKSICLCASTSERVPLRPCGLRFCGNAYQCFNY